MDDVLLNADRLTIRSTTLSIDEMVTVSSICNRMSRMLGLLDREGLKQDLAIVHANAPLDFDALAEADDQVFIEELLRITDATLRDTSSIRSSFTSLFSLGSSAMSLA